MISGFKNATESAINNENGLPSKKIYVKVDFVNEKQTKIAEY